MSKGNTVKKSLRLIELLTLRLKYGVDDFSPYINDDDIGDFCNEWYCVFRNNEYAILFKYIDMEQVYNNLETIYKEVSKYVNDLIFDSYFEQHFFKYSINNPGSNIQGYINYYKSLPVYDYMFFYPIHGITIDEETLMLPTCKIINREYIVKHLEQLEYPLIHRVKDLLPRLSTHSSFIEFTVNSRNTETANGIAKDTILQYEACLRIIANQANVSITDIFDNDSQRNSFYIVPNGSSGRVIDNVQEFRDYSFKLNRDVFTKAECCGILKLIGIANKNDIQNRMLNAVKWLGKSYGEKDLTVALIETFFSLESLFSREGMGNIKTRIAEYTSFILGNTFESRVRIYNEIIKLYKIRSDVVHGKNIITHPEHIEKAIQYAREAIFVFFNIIPIKDISTTDELDSYIQKLRFQ